MSIFSRQRASSAAEAATQQGVVSGIEANDTLNIRSAPGAGNQLVGRLKNGEGVEVLGSRSGWLHIRSGRGEGWVSGEYVQTTSRGEAERGGQQQQQGSGGGQGEQEEQPEARQGFWSRLFGRRGGEEQGKGQASSGRGMPRELSRLLNRGDLSAAQVQQARALIEQLPAEQQPEAWQALQAATPYINQLSVKSRGPRHGAGSAEVDLGPVICNLTSLAMCMQVLGIPNPDPNRTYPEALEAIRARVAPGVWRGDEASWARIAPHVGIRLRQLSSGSSSKALGRSFWQGQARAALRGGSAVIASITGHVVRIQEINDAGIVADDPAGPTTLKAGGSNSISWGNGNNRFWSWADVEAHHFRYVGVVSKA